MIDHIEAFAGSATDWFDAVREAIEQREEHLVEADDSQPAYDAAATAVQDARRKANRLYAVVPYGSDLGKRASALVQFLEAALAELEDWPPQDENDDDDEDDDHDDSDLPIEDAIAEARLCHRFGLEAFGAFIESAAIETHRAYFPIRRIVVRTATALPRVARRFRRDRRLARERKAAELRLEAQRTKREAAASTAPDPRDD